MSERLVLLEQVRVMEAHIKHIEAENDALRAERAAEIISNTRSIYTGTEVMKRNEELTVENTHLRDTLEKIAQSVVLGLWRGNRE